MKLNDCVEKYNRSGRIRKYLGFIIRKVSKSLEDLILNPKIRINERVVEYPWVFQKFENIDRGSKILDIGCVSSRFPIQIASLGYKITAYDVREYTFKHKNLTFIRKDFLKNNLPKNSINIVTCISTIEHVGLNVYKGQISYSNHKDRRMMKEIRRVLLKNGKLLLTAPFGVSEVTKKHKIYNWSQIKELIKGFDIIEVSFSRRITSKNKDYGFWVPSNREELSKIRSPGLPVNGNIRLFLKKK